MKILVTGSNGFIGKHLSLILKRRGHEVLPFDIHDDEITLTNYVNQADFIVHLAGVNRPGDAEEYYRENGQKVSELVDLIKDAHKNTPIILSSSVQADLDNDYGKSKKMGEDILLRSELPVYIYRLCNVFGKWGKPNYNSASATFCYNIAHNLPVYVRDENYIVNYVYIDDVVNEFVRIIELKEHKGSKDILSIKPTYECSLGHLVELLKYFKDEVESDRHLPIIHNDFEFKLFKTFCDYLSDEGYEFNYTEDERGYFEEIYKSKKYGQISDNMMHPGIIKGGHYHTYKKEIFYTVIGECEIKQKDIHSNELIVDVVNGKEPRLIDIKIESTHQIKNIGNKDSHTLMWVSEIFKEETSDTYKKEVE